MAHSFIALDKVVVHVSVWLVFCECIFHLSFIAYHIEVLLMIINNFDIITTVITNF